LLLCGKAGAVTPLHFDEQQNLFAQLHGRKRVRLFHPEDYAKLYPWPLGHPYDRQSRIVLPPEPGSTVFESERDRERFPEFGASPSTEYYVDLEAGEVLYVPQYWWHQMEGETDNISMSWWFKHSSKDLDPTNLDFSKVSFVAIRRNLERLIGEMCGGQALAPQFFLAVAGGRIPLPTKDANGKPCTTLKPLVPYDIAAAASVQLRPEWVAVLNQAVQFATMVLPPGFAPDFIRGIAAGRFVDLAGEKSVSKSSGAKSA
jgi:Cupin-like domain